MRRGIAIFFVSVMLFRGFDLLIEGLAMIPSLFAHYHTHTHHSHFHHDEELSFLEFFYQHYGVLKHHDDDGGDHSNLPFSQPGKICGDFEITSIKNTSIPSAFGPWEDESSTEFGWNSFYSHLYFQDIFHPPLV